MTFLIWFFLMIAGCGKVLDREFTTGLLCYGVAWTLDKCDDILIEMRKRK